ncbi:MAG: hypothetical protein JRN67_10430 [Nitrososphaerota archaeon]|nr:hypothetical protein [Nitrososphaerota archaeon]
MTDWQLDPQRTALVIVDVQNDYAHKEGHLGKKMGMGVQRARKILPTIRKLQVSRRVCGMGSICPN